MSTKFNRNSHCDQRFGLVTAEFFILIFSQFLGNQMVGKLQPPIPLYLAAAAT